MVMPRGYPTPPASANGGSAVHGNGNANGMGSWGRASQSSKKSKGTKDRPASNASVGSLLLGGRRSGSVSRDIGADGNTTTRGGFMSRFREMRLSGPAHTNAGSVGHGNDAARGDERARGRGIERGNSRSGSGSRSSSRSSASTYYVLPSVGQKVKILVSFHVLVVSVSPLSRTSLPAFSSRLIRFSIGFLTVIFI